MKRPEGELWFKDQVSKSDISSTPGPHWTNRGRTKFFQVRNGSIMGLSMYRAQGFLETVWGWSWEQAHSSPGRSFYPCISIISISCWGCWEQEIKPPGARTQMPKEWHSKSRKRVDDPPLTPCKNPIMWLYWWHSHWYKGQGKTVPFVSPSAGIASLPVMITSKILCTLTSCCVHAGVGWGSRHWELWCHDSVIENKNVHIPAQYHPATFLGIRVKETDQLSQTK